MKTDVKELVIIGGGPAGVAAAISAHNNGVKDITIIEKEPFGRHRIGEILLTQTVQEFIALGIDKEVYEFAKKYDWTRKFAAAYVHGKDRKPWQVLNNHPLSKVLDEEGYANDFICEKRDLWFTLMVRRHEFDEALREIATRRGICIIHGNVKNIDIKKEEDRENSYIKSIDVVGKDGEETKIIAKFFVDATGQQAVVARSIKERRVLGDWGLQARYAYLSGVNFEEPMKHGLFKEGANILQFEEGWSWIAYLGRDLTSVGIVSRNWSKEDDFWEKLKRLPEYKLFGFDKAVTKDYLGNDTEADNFYAHPDYRFRSDIMRGSNWASVGDAAMFLDPLLSQGVTLAISFGRMLGEIYANSISKNGDTLKILREYESAYISEVEVLNKVVSLWYQQDFGFDKEWASVASKISKIFGRDIGNDVESFRWVSNLENIHHIIRDKHDRNFLKELNDVNTIKAIHDFEKSFNFIA